MSRTISLVAVLILVASLAGATASAQEDESPGRNVPAGGAVGLDLVAEDLVAP